VPAGKRSKIICLDEGEGSEAKQKEGGTVLRSGKASERYCSCQALSDTVDSVRNILLLALQSHASDKHTYIRVCK